MQCLSRASDTCNYCPLPQIIVYLLIAGGWNLLNMSNESSWDINDPLFLLEKLLGSSAFFTVGVTVDDKNSSNHIIVVCTI